jgi:uncharacterized membrane protein
MTQQSKGAPFIRPMTFADILTSLRAGLRDFTATPAIGLFFASIYVLCGLLMTWITYQTGHTFWLILAVLGFPLIGAFAALGLYEVSRRIAANEPLIFSEIASVVWSHKNGQLPWLAVIVVVVFLFWFFLGHMIFALFLGLSPMTNVSSSFDVFLTSDGLMMLAFGTAVGTIFAIVVFSICVLGMPMILDRDVDFITAMITSMGAVRANPLPYLVWGLLVGIITLVAMAPFFLGLFIALPILGHATWHLYKRVSTVPA